MRVRLKERDIRFTLTLLRREKARFEEETKDIEEEMMLLKRLLPDWRNKFVNQSPYGFHRGFRYIKDRLAYLKHKQRGRWEYSRALRYLTLRYESMLRGKAGRPPKISTGWLDFCFEQLEKAEMVP